MKRYYKLAIALAATLLLSAAWYAASLSSGGAPEGEHPHSRKVPAVGDKSVSAKAARGFKVSKSVQKSKPRAGAASAEGAAAEGEEADADEKLTPEMRSILADIQSALDNDDRKALSKVCDRIAQIQRERGEGAVPVSVRAKAVEAIGQFLPATLADLVGFMADSDPEVVDSAFEQLDNMLNDTTIGDRELSGMFVSISKVLTNEDAVDSLAMAIDISMRNSVKVDTCKKILDVGNETVVTRLKESIAEMLEVEVAELPGDKESLKTKLSEWLEENPDGEDDEEFYKGIE